MKIAEIVAAAIKGEDLNNGAFIQNQHKTYNKGNTKCYNY